MKVMPNRLDRGFSLYQAEFEKKALDVLRSGWYVLGRQVQCFEKEFAQYLDIGYCAGVASGLDALWIALKMLGIGQGDEVIVQGNAYIASVMGITINGAVPVFVEPDKYFNIDALRIEEKITEKTKAILVVHLYGQASNMDAVMAVAKNIVCGLLKIVHNLMGQISVEKRQGRLVISAVFLFIRPKIWGRLEMGAQSSQTRRK